MLEKIRFQASVPGDLDSLLEFYESYSVETANVAYDDIRLAKTKRYPILVKYKIVAGIPVVLAVFHSKSKPNA